MPTRERDEERAARAVVAAALGLQVTWNDDGRSPGLVDAEIHGPCGPVPLEVTSDHDVEHRKQWAALERIRHRLDVPDLPVGLYLHITPTASVRRLRQRLPEVLRGLQQLAMPGLIGSDVPEALLQVGVEEWSAFPNPGRVVIFTRGWSNLDDPIDLNGWTARILQREADVATKLAAYPHPFNEAHVFAWATEGSADVVYSSLRFEEPQGPLPAEGPSLPRPITDVWLGHTHVPMAFLHGTREGWRRVAVDEPFAGARRDRINSASG